MQQEIGLTYYGSWTWDLDEPWQSGPWKKEEKTITQNPENVKHQHTKAEQKPKKTNKDPGTS